MTHQHPPTECDRALKEKVITDRDIQKSVSWYEQNWDQVAEALPVAVEGEIYTSKWQHVFDYQTLPAYRSGALKGLSVAYVYLPLRRLFKGLRERAGPQ